MTKFYIKIKTPNGRVYYPFVEGVMFDNIPCNTATEAHNKGIELFKLAAKNYSASAYNREEIEDG